MCARAAPTSGPATSLRKSPSSIGSLGPVDADRTAGVEAACALVERVRDHGGFAGVHLVGVGRYRDVAARLEATGWARSARSGDATPR